MKKTETKDKILDASYRLMSERGYIGTTTREIAREAGVTELTVFRHFGSKEIIFEEVLKKFTIAQDFKEAIRNLKGVKYEDALLRIGQIFYAKLHERKCMVMLVNCEINKFPDKLREVHARFVDETIETFARMIAKYKRSGTVRDLPDAAVARVFMGMVFVFFHREELMRGRTVPEEEIQQALATMIDIFVHGTLRR